MANSETMIFEDMLKLVEAMAHDNAFVTPEDSVVIGVNDPSIAIKASVPVSAIYSGFDWASGQVRIESTEVIYTLSYLKEMIPNIEEQLREAHKERWDAWKEQKQEN